jgi:LacI family transcriptional regulator, galactose operon repressor
MKSKVRISDIALQCGVSVATVSLTLNNKPGVSQSTRARILEIADELGYPNSPAPTLARNNSLKTIGMVVKTDPDITPQANPFYSKIIVGIEDVCRRDGINLLFATLPVDKDNHPMQVPQLVFNDAVDGLLLVGTFVDQTISSLSNQRTPPIVLVDGYSDTESYDTVISDNFRAAYQAVTYLIEKGHRHIGLVGSEPNCYPSLKERRNGYLRALKENGINRASIADFNINHSHGYEETILLLKAHPEITALFCVNDDVGSAAIRAVQDQGRDVPKDISIIGYDDTYIAVNTRPALTTLRVDTLAMGRAAVHLLSLRMENPESARMSLTIHTSLVERESVSVAQPHSIEKEQAIQ